MPSVTFDVPNPEFKQERPPWRTETPDSLECICLHAQESNSVFKRYIQHVEFDQNKEWQKHGCSLLPQDYPTEDIKEYSFQDLFTLMNWTDVDKIVLAMQLSYALSYYHAGKWLSGRWKQSNIRFFKWGAQIPCKPWLNISLPNKTHIEPAKCLFHPFPQLLELGVILLELQIGQTLESFLHMKPAKDLNEKWAFATKIYFQNLHGGNLILSRHYRHAIEFCLKPGKAPSEPELVRKAIYENVVLPLEKAISDSALNDENFESLDLGLIKRVTLPGQEPARINQPAESSNQPIFRDETTNFELKAHIPRPEEQFATAEPEEGFELFGDEEESQRDETLVMLLFKF